MNWYVKYEGTGAIAGPMSHTAAELAVERTDGMMFSEAIFDHEEVVLDISSEVESLISDLGSMRDGEMAVVVGGLSQLCQRAIDVVTNLSAKKVVRGTIEGGVLSLEEVSEGVDVDIRDYDTDGIDEDNLDEDKTGTHFQAG